MLYARPAQNALGPRLEEGFDSLFLSEDVEGFFPILQGEGVGDEGFGLYDALIEEAQGAEPRLRGAGIAPCGDEFLVAKLIDIPGYRLKRAA